MYISWSEVIHRYEVGPTRLVTSRVLVTSLAVWYVVELRTDDLEQPGAALELILDLSNRCTALWGRDLKQ